MYEFQAKHVHLAAPVKTLETHVVADPSDITLL